ncbi:hypothetical protein C5167_042680 [Papaver somniferum]|uniref:Uncharacterized protein n=1 Tax=Papaver somniferum TaxID=3469 RepID=A0A4Y7L3I0_PAPSO|nr:hypothetical protein C5167_042680 [Papaver somniferum]
MCRLPRFGNEDINPTNWSGDDPANATCEVINEKYKCQQCKGNKVTKEKKVLEVHVEKGMQNGQKIVFEGQADEAVVEDMSMEQQRQLIFFWTSVRYLPGSKSISPAYKFIHLCNIKVRMSEWSKAPESSSGPRQRAWVQTPLLTTSSLQNSPGLAPRRTGYPWSLYSPPRRGASSGIARQVAPS